MRNGIAALVVFGGVVIISIFLLLSIFFTLPANQCSQEKRINIPKGMRFNEIKTLLYEEDLIASPAILDICIHLRGSSRGLKAGDYLFKGGESYTEIIDTLERGQVTVKTVTVPEGLTAVQICDLLNSAGIADRMELLDEFRNVSDVSNLDSEASDLEGYLFPDTYFLSDKSSAYDIRKVMTGRFLEVFRPEWIMRAEELDLTVREVVTLASLVEKETARSSERELISSVFHNRLRIGMPLQCDPTVIYALNLEGLFDGNLRRDDLKYDSPYNTYVYRGIPPGPIANPGAASIEAVLYPADGKYLYFVSKNDGTHHFSSSLREHNNAVNKYQKRYWRQKWQQER